VSGRSSNCFIRAHECVSSDVFSRLFIYLFLFRPSFSETRRPIATTFCMVIGIKVAVLLIRRHQIPLELLRSKNCPKCGVFCAPLPVDLSSDKFSQNERLSVNLRCFPYQMTPFRLSSLNVCTQCLVRFTASPARCHKMANENRIVGSLAAK